MPKKEAVCGSPAQPQSAGVTLALACANISENTFITAGEYVTLNFVNVFKKHGASVELRFGKS